MDFGVRRIRRVEEIGVGVTRVHIELDAPAPGQADELVLWRGADVVVNARRLDANGVREVLPHWPREHSVRYSFAKGCASVLLPNLAIVEGSSESSALRMFWPSFGDGPVPVMEYRVVSDGPFTRVRETPLPPDARFDSSRLYDRRRAAVINTLFGVGGGN